MTSNSFLWMGSFCEVDPWLINPVIGFALHCGLYFTSNSPFLVRAKQGRSNKQAVWSIALLSMPLIYFNNAAYMSWVVMVSCQLSINLIRRYSEQHYDLRRSRDLELHRGAKEIFSRRGSKWL